MSKMTVNFVCFLFWTFLVRVQNNTVTSYITVTCPFPYVRTWTQTQTWTWKRMHFVVLHFVPICFGDMFCHYMVCHWIISPNIRQVKMWGGGGGNRRSTQHPARFHTSQLALVTKQGLWCAQTFIQFFCAWGRQIKPIFIFPVIQ